MSANYKNKNIETLNISIIKNNCFLLWIIKVEFEINNSLGWDIFKLHIRYL